MLAFADSCLVRIRACAAGLLLAVAAACGAPAPASETALPPPLPENAATADFEAAPAAGSTQTYWGVKPGEALPILWDDLMPAGAEEELLRQQQEFYAMLEARYRANATSLYDADPLAAIAEGSELDQMPQFGTFDVVKDFDGMRVRIPGYVVPFDFDLKKRHSEFLFVPYMGACIHTPPPPPNQIVYVTAETGVLIPDIWAPYYIEGTFGSGKFLNDTGNAAYSLALAEIEPYPYP